MTGTLYVVGTPIGNLSDFSPRAVETLEAVDFIAAEDTRVTLKLLNHFGVKKPLVSYFEHNKRDHGEKILARLEAGENCALVSTPANCWWRSVRSAGSRCWWCPGPARWFPRWQSPAFRPGALPLRAF